MADAPATAAPVAPAPAAAPAKPDATQPAEQQTAPVSKISAEKLAQLEGLGEEEAQEAVRLLLKRAPVKVKTKHGEQKIDDLDLLSEYARRRGTMNADVQALLKQKTEFERERKQYEALAQGQPEAVQEILQRNPGALQAAAKMLFEQYQKEQEAEQMTPRERELRAKLEQLEPMAEQLKRQEAARQQQEEQQQRNAALEQTKQELYSTAAQVLKAAGYSSQGAPFALRTLIPILTQYVEAGVPFEPADIAAQLKEQRQAIFADEIEQLTPDELVSVYPELGRKAAQAYLAKAKGLSTPKPQPSQQQAPAPKQNGEESQQDRWDLINKMQRSSGY